MVVCLIAANLENVLQLLVRGAHASLALPGRFGRRFHPVSATVQSDRQHAPGRLVSAISKAPQPTRTLYSALIANVFATNAAWLTD